MRARKLKLKQRLHDLHRQTNRTLLRQVLQAWKQGQSAFDPTLEEDCYVPLQCRKIKLLAEYKSYSKKLQKGLKQAKQTHLRECLDNMPPSTPASGILRSLRSYIGPTNVKMCKQKTIPLVRL